MTTFFKLSVLLLGTAIAQISAAEISYEQELKQGCAKIKSYAQLGKKYYDQRDYAKAIDQFELQASWTHFCILNQEESGSKLTARDMDLANNNVGLSYAKSGQPLWARAWFLRDGTTDTSRFNLKQLPPPAISSSLEGTYVRPNGFGQWNYVFVSKKAKSYQIDFQGYYFGLRGLIYGPNMGNFTIQMPLSQKQAQYRYQDCKIDLAFNADTKIGQFITIKQSESESACGFGHNVFADGIYQKVESDLNQKTSKGSP
ncbi:hypothetical protein [Acinetobacter soli]|uniref:Uncharacterized protein n=1 Tax=Acinetobacter soli NIPH 2899 TaxID=1217677 RepID=A0ABN0K1E0_9GAMM|nr:hypothetical protein [Acinetobacter soli]ENV61716.1 hypothetical protein F950_00999 [Acinetobacter soli NIPH 2899]